MQYCQDKSQGGINLVNPDDAAAALMVKWVTKALEPRSSNLHVMLRYRLDKYQPYPGQNWLSRMEFFMVPSYQSHLNFLGWNCITLAWKVVFPELQYVPPSNLDELLSCSPWFYPTTSMIGSCFSKLIAFSLHKAGLRRY